MSANRNEFFRQRNVKEQPDSDPRRENYVQVNIWLPIEGNCGHVAIFTSNLNSVAGPYSNYYSLWPASQGENPIPVLSNMLGLSHEQQHILKLRDARYQASYADDVRQEGGREADIKIKLYTLNMDSLQQQATDMMDNQVKNFQLIGSTGLARFLARTIGCTTSENCTSFACQLLEAAGIKELTDLRGNIDPRDRRIPQNSSVRSSVNSSSIKEPKALAKMVVDAKIRELTNNDATMDYDAYWQRQGHHDTNAPYQQIRFNNEERQAQEERRNHARSRPR